MMANRLIVTGAALLFLCSHGFAQVDNPGAVAGRALELSDAQKQTIFQSISKTQKNNAAPTGFRVAVGAAVPAGIMLEPVTATIADLIPDTRGLEAGLVEGQVMLVDPKDRHVLAAFAATPDQR